MQSYTTALQKPLELISWEDDNFIEELLRVVVMEQIICENGIGWDWTGGGGKIVGKSA